MTGAVETAVAKSAAGIAGKLVFTAAQPLVAHIQHALVRRGIGKIDAFEVLKMAEQEKGRPATLRLVFELPPGLTQRQVNELSTTPEMISITRILLSRFLVDIATSEPMMDIPSQEEVKLQLSVYELFVNLAPRTDGPELERYCANFFRILRNHCLEIAAYLIGKFKKGSELMVWASNIVSRQHLSLIESYLELMSGDYSLDRQTVSEWKSSYLSSFNRRHSSIEIPDLSHRRSVEYEKLFVGSSLIPASPSSKNLADPSGSGNDLLRDDELLPMVRRTVLLGDPGAGKSTTSTLLALRSWDKLELIPILVVLKYVRFDGGGFSFLDEVDRRLRSYYQCPAPRGLIKKLAIEGRLFVVFDGLDELIDGKTRRDAVGVIETICTMYPLVRVLVTSRRVGYSVAKLDEESFDEFRLAPFGDLQVEEYVTKWLSLQPRLSTEDLDELVADIMSSTESMTDLRQNPLLLAFICVLYSGHKHIPRRRPELYRKCIELLLVEWDRARDITADVAAIEVYEVALMRLAHLILTSADYSNGLTEKAVYELIVPALVDESVPDARTAQEIVRDLLELCRGRAWIFTDVGLDPDGNDIFSFTHTSFMEYFAARYLDRISETPEDMADLLIPNISSGKWEVVAQICLALRDRHSVAGASRSVMRMLSHSERILRERALIRRKNAIKYSSSDGASQSAVGPGEDVPIVEFLLKTSDTLTLSSDALTQLMEMSLEQMAEGNTATLVTLLEKRYRYSMVVRESLPKVISSAMSELVRPTRGAIDPVVPSKVWIGAHFAYFLGYSSSYILSAESVRQICSRIEVPTGAVTDAWRSSDVAWNVALHLGMNPLVNEAVAKKRPMAGAGTLLHRIFEPCGSPVRRFGPVSTVDWIADCFSSDIRHLLRPTNALRLLRVFGGSFSDEFFEREAPSFASTDGIFATPYRLVADRLTGYGADAMLGWLVVSMSSIEAMEKFATSTEFDERRSRREWVRELGLQPVLAHFTTDKSKHRDRINSWLNESISFWVSYEQPTG